MSFEIFETLLSESYSRSSLTVKSANADLKEKGRNFHYRGKDLSPLITVLRKQFLRLDERSIRLNRQISSKSSAAEAIVIDVPNGEIFVCFGSQKFREQLVEAIYVGIKYPDIFPKLLVDNITFYEKLQYFCKRLPQSPKDCHSEVVRCLLILLHYFGTRSVGGFDTLHMSHIRIVRKLPKKPKRKVFRRGYDDKGSLAPEDKRNLLLANEFYYQFLLDTENTLQDLKSLGVESFSLERNYVVPDFYLKPGFAWIDSEVETDNLKIKEITKIINMFIIDNQLDPRDVARELTTLRSQG